jgi:CRP-like cAMP-binding protein
MINIMQMIFNLGAVPHRWAASDGPAIKRLARRMVHHMRSLRKGEVLWKEGDEARGMGLLLTGRLVTLRTKGGERRVMPGAVVGVRGFMCGDSYHRTVKAKEDSKLAMIDSQMVDEIESTDKQLLCVVQKVSLAYLEDEMNDLSLFEAGSRKISSKEDLLKV